MTVTDVETALQALEIRIAYGGEPEVVKGVSLTVKEGEITCIVGPNGAGKSSVLAALAGVVIPNRGEIRLGGTPLVHMSRMERARRIGYLPQVIRPSIPYTVQELVTLGRYASGTGFDFETEDDKKAVRRAMKETRTEHLAKRLFGEISGGERQRVLIASVLAGEPEAILLDEPTASLDIGYGYAVFANLAELAARGRAVGIVTHDLNLAGQFAATVALLSDGKIVAEGPPEEVIAEAPLRSAYGGGFTLLPQPDTKVPAVLPSGKGAPR